MPSPLEPWVEAAERAVRYAAAAPAIAGADAWVDLGCGDGTVARTTLPDPLPGTVVLVDPDAAALARAQRALPAARTLAADLGDPRGVRELGAALAGLDAPTITCFGLLERLANPVALVDLLAELAEERAATVLLSVPNDAAELGPAPAGPLTWGEGAFEELRRLLPAGVRVARQLALAGSVLLPDGAPRDAPVPLAPAAPDPGQPPTHLLAAFGPRAADLVPAALAAPADRRAHRRHELARDAELARLTAELDAGGQRS